MLFNLQGAHRFQRRAFILPQRFFFVKHFFKFFQTLSRSHSQIVSPRFAALADSLIILPHSFPLVKHFFQAFSSFFKLFRALSGKPSWWRRPRRQLIEDITLGTICQALFSGFLNRSLSAEPIRFHLEVLKRFSCKAFQVPAESAR